MSAADAGSPAHVADARTAHEGGLAERDGSSRDARDARADPVDVSLEAEPATGAVRLRWEQSAGTHYQLHRSTQRGCLASAIYPLDCPGGHTTSNVSSPARVEGLVDGTPYYFRLEIGAGAERAYSHEVGARPNVIATNGMVRAAGESFSCGILSAGGLLKCWGSGKDGRLLVPAGSYRTLDLGGAMGCAIADDRTVCWGSESDMAQPLLAAQQIDVATAGESCGLASDGVTCRYGSAPPVTYPGAFAAFALGPTALCLLPADGSQLRCESGDSDDPLLAVPTPFPPLVASER